MDLGQVFTNTAVAKYMVSQLNIDKQSRILDPCFGDGAFIKACIHAGYLNVHGYEIDENLYKMVSLQFPELTLVHGDFLKANNDIKFDAIIMNPPYIRQEKIDNLKPIGITKCELRKNPIFHGLANSANMYMYFVLKALDMLKIGGEMIVIFPSSWLNAKIGRAFKQLILKQAFIEKQIYVSGNVFEKSVLVDVIILKIVKELYNDEPIVEYLKFENESFSSSEKTKDSNLIVLDIPFSRYATVRRGLTTGCNSIFINPASPKAFNHCVNIISSPKSIYGYGTRSASFDKLLLIDSNSAVNVQEYLSTCETRIKESQSPKMLYRKIKSGIDWYSIKPIDCSGILFSYFVRNDMKFVMNDSEAVVRDNFYIIKPSIDSYLMFSLLNNYYTYYQLEYSGKRYGAGLLKLQRYDIENVSFPNISIFSQDDIQMLISYAKNMVDTGNNSIDEITEIISNYSLVNTSTIKDQYNTLKAIRLEGDRYGY